MSTKNMNNKFYWLNNELEKFDNLGVAKQQNRVQTNFRGENPDKIYTVNFKSFVCTGFSGYTHEGQHELEVYGDGMTVSQNDQLDELCEDIIFEHVTCYLDFSKPINKTKE